MKPLLLPSLFLAVLISGCGGWDCNATTCPNGCCDSSNTCVLNGGASQCGLGGQTCQECQTCIQGMCGCAAGLQRVSGSCQCTPSSCASGCCDFTYDTKGSCRVYADQSNSYCGTKGARCDDCSYPAQCKSGVCTSCVSRYGSCTTSSNCCSAGDYCGWDSSFNKTVCQ